MTRTWVLGTIGAAALLVACAETPDSTDATTDADADLRALNECRTRAAIAVNPAAGGGGGLAGSSAYDRALAQCLRELAKNRRP